MSHRVSHQSCEMSSSPPFSSSILTVIAHTINPICQMRNVWLMGGLGSRGLLYHALLAQLLVEAATAADTETGPGTGVSAG